mgnify:FL=1
MDNALLLSFLSECELREQKFVLIGERFYSQVYRASTIGRVIKIITSHRVLQSEGFRTKGEAIHFSGEIVTYMEKLAQLGVSVSPISETNISIMGAKNTGESFIVISTPDGGTSVEMLYEKAQSDASLREFSLEIINNLLPVLYQPKLTNGYNEVAIDPVPSNFTLAKGRMTYIDFTPPRYFSLDCGYRVEYPQPASQIELHEAIWRYYEPCGILTRWLTDSCRIRPDGRNIFLDTLRESLSDELWKSLASQLQSLSLPSHIQRLDWRNAIYEVNQLIDLRDMACAIAATDCFDLVSTKQWLKDFFIASRHHPGQSIPDDKLDTLKTLLLDRIESM